MGSGCGQGGVRGGRCVYFFGGGIVDNWRSHSKNKVSYCAGGACGCFTLFVEDEPWHWK